MTKQKQITEKGRTGNVELSDEQLDSIAGGVVCLAAFVRRNSTTTAGSPRDASEKDNGIKKSKTSE
jgi:hypothetical protein